MTVTEQKTIKHLGSQKRNAAVLVGFIGSMLGLLTLFTPPSDPTVLSVEVAVLLVLGIVLAAVSRSTRLRVVQVLASGTAFDGMGVVRRLAQGTLELSLGKMTVRPTKGPGFFGIPEGSPVAISFAGPTDGPSPQVLVIGVNGTSFQSPTFCSWENAP